MKLKYGSYEHGDNEVRFQYSAQQQFGQSGMRTALKVRWVIDGVKRAANAAALTTALEALEAAYAQDGNDLIFLDNDSNETIHTTRSADTINGVRVVQRPSYSAGLQGAWGAQTEYLNRRTYRIILEAELPNVEGLGIVAYMETVSMVSNGLPKFVLQEALTGIPQYQQVSQASKIVIRQQGRAVGYDSYIPFPAYIYSTSGLKHEPFLQESGTPLNYGSNAFTNFPTRWLYHYEFATVAGSLAVPEFPT